MQRRRRLGAALLAFALTSCASLRGEDGPTTGQPGEARVEVVNRGWSEMVIYADRNGNRFRLGSVTSLSSAVFKIPSSLVGAASSLRFTVSPIGSAAVHTTEAVTVSPGERVEFEILDNLALSSVSVRTQ
jgi:hypothetical protein